MKVGVAGYSGPVALPPVSEIADECVELGRRLAEKGHLIVNGGRDGVMELVSRGAKEVGGKVVGVLPFVKEGANEYLDFALFTGLDFQMRSFVMLKNMDVMVAVGGEVGTAIEILGAYANAIPVILFSLPSIRNERWAITTGATMSESLSPTPPVECLSTFGPSIEPVSMVTPDASIDRVSSSVSAAVIPRKSTAMRKAVIW